MSFWAANVLVSLAFLAGSPPSAGWCPGIGTVVQVVVVGGVASLLLDALPTPATWQGQALLLLVGAAGDRRGHRDLPRQPHRRRTGRGGRPRLGSAGAVPVELQRRPGRLARSAAGCSARRSGPGTIVVILLLGPLVDVTSRVLGLDVHQGGDRSTRPRADGRPRRRAGSALPLLGVTGFDDLLDANRRYAEDFSLTGFDGIAHAGVAIVTCMDSRIDPLRMVGLEPGDAKILRNPGGRVTDDALVALVLGVSLLEVRRILVVPAHPLRDGLGERDGDPGPGRRAAGEGRVLGLHRRDQRPAAGAPRRRTTRAQPPLMPAGVDVAGFVYDVDTGLLGDPVP